MSSRKHVLALAALFVLSLGMLWQTRLQAQTCVPWSSPTTWPLGRVPTLADDLVIPAGRSVCLDGDNRARSLIVEGVLTKEGGQPVDLWVAGNVVVRGTGAIIMPNSNNARWRIRIVGSDEAAYVGGGDTVLDTDRGLWVIQGGRLDLHGQEKTPWTRLMGSAAAGDTQVLVQAAVNWRAGDVISITPTAPPSLQRETWADYDERTITSVAPAAGGVLLGLSSPLTFAHPAITVWPGTTYTAEVLNLSRTGNVEGQDSCDFPCTTSHRAHIWIMNDRPVAHTLSYINIQHMAPQQFRPGDAPPPGQLIENLGRYPLHFHKNGENSRGTVVRGVVVQNFGAHAIVTHDSNGITLDGNIMHHGYSTAQWWDSAAEVDRCTDCPRPAEPRDLVLTSNVASLLRFVPDFRGFVMAGFFVGRQDGNRYEGNVAVGNGGNATASGYMWPEFSHGNATFSPPPGRENVAHNNRTNGIYEWQNDDLPHFIANFVAYHNGKAGIESGAYTNCYRHQDITLYANGLGYGAAQGGAGIILHSIGQQGCPAGAPSWVRARVDAGGLPDAVRTADHAATGFAPVTFVQSEFRNYTRAGITLATTANSIPDWLVVSADTVFSGNRYWVLGTVPPTSTITDYGLRLVIRRADQPGTPAPQWNASTQPCTTCGTPPSATPAPTATATVTATATPSPSPAPPTATMTPTATATPSPVPTATATPTVTVTATPTAPPTMTPTQTPTATPTATMTMTPTPTATSTATPTPTASPSPTPAPTMTATRTPTPSPSSTGTGTHTGRVAWFPNGVFTAFKGATVRIAGWTGTTDATGFFATPALPAGTYQRTVFVQGFNCDVRQVTIIAGRNVHVGAIMQPGTTACP